MALSDAVRAFRMAAESSHTPGVRILNAAGPLAWVKDPTADILRNWWGADVDLSVLESEGHRYDSTYDVGEIEQQLGFVAARLPEVV
jgi:uncharacterized protein involved in copper resistance